MNLTRLDELSRRFPRLHTLVVGDFFLDRYLIIDRRLSETSLETGLEAYQVVEVKCQPGGAGCVTANLLSLGVNVAALGVIGKDGEGYELKRSLTNLGADIETLIQSANLFTPTYAKPMLLEEDGLKREIQRLDIKNREPLPIEVEDRVIRRLRELTPAMDAVVVADQIQERNCGVITDKIRDEISALARLHPAKPFMVDSRERIGLFRDVIIKPNQLEATLAVRPDWEGEPTLRAAQECGEELFRRNRKPVFLTAGENGIFLFTEQGCKHIKAISVDGEIDIVGAGDSVMAGIASALCCGAEPAEAAFLGALIASITIQQVGTTGAATPAQVREQAQRLVHSEQ
jgi:rfaE bifunctional protein kinase chain/domain